MNLGELRAQFITLSGLTYLVNADNIDNGANWYINAGQRWLDRHQTIKKSAGRFFKNVAAGKVGVIIPDIRIIDRVWCMDSDSRLRLEKVDAHVLRGTDSTTGENAFVKPFSDHDAGRPVYYSPGNVRMVPETDRLDVGDADGIIGYMDVMFGAHYSYNSILFMPPTDAAYTIEVEGKFYSPSLSADTDRSEWSVVYPEILIMAALMQVEIFQRNMEGTNDWVKAIDTAGFDIENDLAEEESNEVEEMEG